MASLDEQLRKRGWFLTHEAIAELTDGAENSSADDVIRKALDTDLTEMGAGCIPEDLARNFRNVEKVSGPAVWQIQRIRNVAAPKADPDNDHGNKFLRLNLTDGVTSFSAVIGGKSGLSVHHTPPGTKLLLHPQSVPVCNGFVILSERDFKILGGTVQHLVEKWKLAKNLSQHKRTSGEAGPPLWVPFGEAIDKDLIKQLKTGGPFKAMDRAGATKGAPNEAFERHRTSTIEEVTAATQGGGKRKVFGGGAREMHDQDIAIICQRGYTAEAAGTALRNNNYNVTAALKSLSLRGDRGARDRPARGPGGPEPPREGGGRFADRNSEEDGRSAGRGFKKGPRGREDNNRDSVGPRGQPPTSGLPSSAGDSAGGKAQPSAPTTLFDMISTQVNLPEQQQQRRQGRIDDVRLSYQSHGQNGFAAHGDTHHSGSYEGSGGNQRGNRNWSQNGNGAGGADGGAYRSSTGGGNNRGGDRFDRNSSRDDFNRRGPDREHRNREGHGHREGQSFRDGGHRRGGHDNATGRGGQRGQRVDNYVAEFPTLPTSRRTEEAPSPGGGATQTSDNGNGRTHSNQNSSNHPPIGAYRSNRNNTEESAGRPARNSAAAAGGGGAPPQQTPAANKLRAGQRVYAKYWEDERMYRAVVHEMAATGHTCVVFFVEYGNYEEVLVQDIEQTSWDDSGSQHGNSGGGGGGGAHRGSGPKDRRPPGSGFRDGGSQRSGDHPRGGYGGGGGSRRPAGGGQRGGYRGGAAYRAVPRRQH